jgi:hypothetical protein
MLNGVLPKFLPDSWLVLGLQQARSALCNGKWQAELVERPIYLGNWLPVSARACILRMLIILTSSGVKSLHVARGNAEACSRKPA